MQGSRVIGLGGGQGAGKTTLSNLIVAAGALRGERIVVLGIDDFYLPKAARLKLAREQHPLLETRGPPGTHDIGRLIAVLDQLSLAKTDVHVPRFDKGIDDRIGDEVVAKDADRILVEGWCIGAHPLPRTELSEPINDLERTEDPTRAWRNYMANALEESYQSLNDKLDSLIYLKVPDMDCVRKWRLDQERERDAGQRMSLAEVNRFVQYYERITLWMLRSTSFRADVVVGLDTNHRVNEIEIRN